jgi:hypothetical protein
VKAGKASDRISAPIRSPQDTGEELEVGTVRFLYRLCVLGLLATIFAGDRLMGVAAIVLVLVMDDLRVGHQVTAYVNRVRGVAPSGDSTRRAMAENQQRRPEPPMTLGDMRDLGVHHLIAFCLNDPCRHSALIDAAGYPDVIEVHSLGKRATCSKCGGKRVDVRPNWNERQDVATEVRF